MSNRISKRVFVVTIFVFVLLPLLFFKGVEERAEQVKKEHGEQLVICHQLETQPGTRFFVADNECYMEATDGTYLKVRFDKP